MLIIISSIDISVYTIVNLIISDQFKQYESLTPIVKMIEILILGYLSSKILNNPLHRHQIICIILFIIIILISVILEGYILNNDQDDGKPFSLEFYILSIVIAIFIFTVNSFQYVFEKYFNGRSLFLELIILLLIVGIDFTVYTIVNLIIGDKFTDFGDLSPIVRLIEIFVLGILSSKLLNTPIQPHHIVCIISFIILIIISIITEGIILNKASNQDNNPFDIVNYFIFVIITIAVFTIDSFQFTFEKFLVDKQFYSPFLLLMYMGIIGIIFLLFVLTFANFFSFEWTFTKFLSSISYFSIKDWIEIVFIYICGIFLNSSLIIIIQQLGTQYVGIGNAIGGIFLLIVKYFTDSKYYLNRDMLGIKSILFIIILIVCLIYTEIIVLNIFSLGDYTKAEIDKRGFRETKNMENLIATAEKDEKAEDSIFNIV